MKKTVLIQFLLIISVGTWGQENSSTGFVMSYNLIANKKPIYSMYGGAVNYRFTHDMAFLIKNERLNKDGLFYGINFQHLYGDSETQTATTYSCSSSGLVTFTKYFEKKENIFNVHLAYQFKPLNKKENLFLRLFIQPGFSVETSFSHYSPEIGCQGYFNKKEKFVNPAINGGVKMLHRVYAGDGFSIDFNYGITHQFIDLTLQQISAFLGIEVAF